MSKARGRACDACHSIKIKCEGGFPCQRCLRLEKTCIVSPPLRQKDRIAELEARLEEATNLLRLHKIQEVSPSRISNDVPAGMALADPQTAQNPNTKKRRRQGTVADDLVAPETDRCSIIDIDSILSKSTQRRLLRRYREEIEPVFPFPVNRTYESLRDESPLLLQAVIFAASDGMLSSNVQLDLTSAVMKLFAPARFERFEKSMDLIWSLLIVSFWYRPARHEISNDVAIDRFMNQVVSIAQHLGISNTDCGVLSIASENTSRSEIGSADAWRTWITCFLLSASLGGCMRIEPRIPWSNALEMRLASLEYGPDALSTDSLLCQLVRAERLCQQISVEAGYTAGSGVILQVTDHAKIRRMQNLVRERKAQLFSAIICPSLELYEHVATMLIHESVLHTPTNSLSFAAPYISERLSLTDFPAPIVTESHVSSLHALRNSCHAVLNTFLTFDITIISSSPLVIFTAKAFYSMWLLVKLHIAITSVGNTYGSFIDVRSLEIFSYLEKLASIGDKIGITDSTFITGLMLRSSRRLREWIQNYDALCAVENVDVAPLIGMETSNLVSGYPDALLWETSNFGSSSYDINRLFGSP